MDTIGSIRPEPTGAILERHLEEVIERLRYLASRKSSALLAGPGAKHSRFVVDRAVAALNEDGHLVKEIHLAGVTPEELPELVAMELGVRPVGSNRRIDLWSAISDFAAGSRLLPAQRCLIFSGVELVDDALIASIDRVLTMLQGSVSTIFWTWQSVREPLRSVLAQHVWMKIDLTPLSPEESAQELAGALVRQNSAIKLAPDAAQVAHHLTRGDIHRLRRLAELAILAAEADELPIIDAEILRSLSGEIQSLV